MGLGGRIGGCGCLVVDGPIRAGTQVSVDSVDAALEVQAGGRRKPRRFDRAAVFLICPGRERQLDEMDLPPLQRLFGLDLREAPQSPPRKLDLDSQRGHARLRIVRRDEAVEMLERAPLDRARILGWTRPGGLFTPPPLERRVDERAETARIKLGRPLIDVAKPEATVALQLEEIRAGEERLEGRDADRLDDRACDRRRLHEARRGGVGGRDNRALISRIGCEQQRHAIGKRGVLDTQQESRGLQRIALLALPGDDERHARASRTAGARGGAREDSVEYPRIARGVAARRGHAKRGAKLVRDQRVAERTARDDAVDESSEHEVRLVRHAGVEPPCDGHAVLLRSTPDLLGVQLVKHDRDRLVAADRRCERRGHVGELRERAIEQPNRRLALAGERAPHVVANDRVKHLTDRPRPRRDHALALERPTEVEHRLAQPRVCTRNAGNTPVVIRTGRHGFVAPCADKHRRAIARHPFCGIADAGRARQPACDIVMAHEGRQRFGRAFPDEIRQSREKRSKARRAERPRLARRGGRP